MGEILRAGLAELRATRTSMKWSAFPPDVIPAWVAEMDCDPCPAVVDAVGEVLRRGDTGYAVAGALGYGSLYNHFWELNAAYELDHRRRVVRCRAVQVDDCRLAQEVAPGLELERLALVAVDLEPEVLDALVEAHSAANATARSSASDARWHAV